MHSFFRPLALLRRLLGARSPGRLAILSLAATLLLLQVSTAVSGEITLVEAYSMALRNHESVSIAREGLFQSERGVSKARSALLPSLRAEGTYTKYSSEKRSSTFLLQPDRARRADLTLEQSLWEGGRDWSLLRQSKKEELLSRAELGVRSEDLLLLTAGEYFGALKAAKEVEIKEAHLKRASEELRVSRARLAAGAATRAALLRAEAEAAGISADLIRAGAELKNAMARLERLTGPSGKGVGGAITLVEPPEAEPLSDPVETLISTALERRRDYTVRKLDRDIAGEGVKQARGRFMPTIKLRGAYSYRDQTPEATFLLNDSLYGGVTINVPIFEGGLRRAELGEARSRLRAAELSRLNHRRDIELQVRSAYNDLSSSASVIESFERRLSFAGENYEMVFKQFSYGLASNVELVDAGATLVSAEMGLMKARYDYQLSLLVLKSATGVLLDEIRPLLAER